MAGSSERRLRVAEKRVKKCLKRDKIDAKSFEIVSTRTRSDHYEFYVLYDGKQSGKNNVGSTPSAQQTTKKIQSALRGMLEEVGIKTTCRRAWEEVSFMMTIKWNAQTPSEACGYVDREHAEELLTSVYFWELFFARAGGTDLTQEGLASVLNEKTDHIVEAYREVVRYILEQDVYDETYIQFDEYPDDEMEYLFEGTGNFDRALLDLARGKLKSKLYEDAFDDETKYIVSNDQLICRMLGATSLADAEAEIAQAILSGEMDA
jgi:hypothetical protein